MRTRPEGGHFALVSRLETDARYSPYFTPDGSSERSDPGIDRRLCVVFIMSRHLLGQVKRAVHHIQNRFVFSAVRTVSTNVLRCAEEKNIVTSAHTDCPTLDVTLVQRLLQTASMWPDKVAIVSDLDCLSGVPSNTLL